MKPLALALLTCWLSSATLAQPASDHPLSADRIVVVGDVHGAYDALVRALRASGVIDAQLAWSGGNAHLVSLGDLLDRGAGARPALDLLMRLQSEAAAAGGRVHVILGNHELMNLIGDWRYVPASEYASYAGPDADTDAGSASERPPGHAERSAAFARDGIYGRWLLAQPAALVINDTAFVHGGLPEIAASLHPAELDRTIKVRLGELLDLREALAAGGVIGPNGDVQADAQRLEQALAAPAGAPEPQTNATTAPAGRPPWPAELDTQVKRFIQLANDDLFGDGGPLWYRGTALCHDLLERPVLQAALDHWQVRRVVVGHTPTWDRRVRERFGGLALLADTGMLHDYYRGQPAPLVIEGDRIQVLYPDAGTAPESPDPRAGLEFDTLSAESVERILANGTIAPLTAGAAQSSQPEAGTDTDDPGAANPPAALQATLPPDTTLVTVSEGAVSLTALFEPGSRAEVERQLAAYRLDRLLGLGLVVPVAEREFAGKRGVVSARWTRTLDEQARASANLARRNWCARGSDYQLMYVFDALVNNRGRSPNNMLYDRITWQFASAGHARAFERSRELPAYLANAPKRIPPALAEALRRLDEPTLRESLGEQLSKAELRAILQRRDDLLTTWTDGEPSR